MPFGIFDYHKSLKHLHVGCEAPRAYFVPFASKEEFLATQDKVCKSGNRVEYLENGEIRINNG